MEATNWRWQGVLLRWTGLHYIWQWRRVLNSKRWQGENTSLRLDEPCKLFVQSLAGLSVKTVWRCGMRPYHLSDCLRRGRLRVVTPCCSSRYQAKRISDVQLSRIHNNHGSIDFSLCVGVGYERTSVEDVNVTKSLIDLMDRRWNQHSVTIIITVDLQSRPPYGIGQAIIFLPCGFFYLLSIYLSIYLFSSPNLSGRSLDVYHTSTHGVALVRI